MKRIPPTPLTCRVVRWRIDVYHGDPSTSGHVNRCPDCQAYFAFAEKMERAARRTAPAWRPNISPELQRRAREIRERARPRVPEEGRLHALARSGVGAVVACALAWLVWAPAPRPMKLVPETVEAQRQVMAIARQNAAGPASVLGGEVTIGAGASSGGGNRAALQQATLGRIATLLSSSFGRGAAANSRAAGKDVKSE